MYITGDPLAISYAFLQKFFHTLEDFLDTDLMIPPDIHEQALIGEYLKKLGNLITLHQRQDNS